MRFQQGLAITAVSVLVAGLAACGSDASSDGAASAASGTGDTVKITISPVLKSQEPQVIEIPRPADGVKIGFNHPILADPGAASVAAGAKKAAEEAGVELDVTDANLDISRQLQSGQSMLDRGYKGILTIELAPNSMDALYAAAASKKVPTVTEFSDRDGSIGEDPSLPATDAVAMILAKYPDGATGVMLSDNPAPVIKAREAAFKAAADASGGKIKILDLQRNLKEDVAGARTVAESMLKSNPDVDFVWGSNDSQAIGAGLAAEAAGKDLVITGMNGSPDGVDAIKSGLIDATWDANQNGQGELMMVNALKALASGKAEPSQLVAFTKIDADNAGDYIPWDERAK